MLPVTLTLFIFQTPMPMLDASMTKIIGIYLFYYQVTLTHLTTVPRLVWGRSTLVYKMADNVYVGILLGDMERSMRVYAT